MNVFRRDRAEIAYPFPSFHFHVHKHEKEAMANVTSRIMINQDCIALKSASISGIAQAKLIPSL
jgi:hypothetical protein